MLVALCLRGCCSVTSFDTKKSHMFEINYKLTFEGIIANIIRCNPEYTFDIYAHGWAPENIKEDIVTKLKKEHNVRSVSIKLESQLNFNDIYAQIENKSYILNDISQYHTNFKANQKNKEFMFQHFKNSLSYAYSIQKSCEQVDDSYDVYISLRWDLRVVVPIILKKLDMNKVHVNKERGHSPIFIGDFILISKTNLLQKFYDEVLFLMIKDSSKIEAWYKYYKSKQHHFPNKRFDLSCYTNQGH